MTKSYPLLETGGNAPCAPLHSQIGFRGKEGEPFYPPIFGNAAPTPSLRSARIPLKPKQDFNYPPNDPLYHTHSLLIPGSVKIAFPSLSHCTFRQLIAAFISIPSLDGLPNPVWQLHLSKSFRSGPIGLKPYRGMSTNDGNVPFLLSIYFHIDLLSQIL